MSVPQDQQSARELVEAIAISHGYLPDEELAKISDPNLRRKIEIAFLTKDRMIGSSLTTLAKNLYSSGARFVFELLQNADDNSYESARALQQAPFVSFKLYHDRIVVDCNEDGFLIENLKAICSVGASSKINHQGYIGEKGIGFKSVFKVAWKVHIQSGSLSFSFTHRKGEPGMGMISPVWEDATEVLDSPLTRMTLYLRDQAREGGTLREVIHRQFSDIQETFLLFMKNLQQVSVRFYDDSGREVSHTTHEFREQEGLVSNRAQLTKTTVTGSETTESTRLFHLCRHQATNLAKNDNRTYSDEELTSRAWSTSQIVLAFPLTEAEVPIVEPQDLFVFMPVTSVGMDFIIQADFVTDANRQNIVADSLRNRNLIDEIAEAFLTAVLQFCEHPTLRYQWMRYLPRKDHQVRGRLWVALMDRISIRLAETPVVFSHESQSLFSMRELFHLSPANLDANDQPLFNDASPETMLSREYTPSDAQVLLNYGGRKVSWTQILAWIKHDLEQGDRSRIRSPASSEDWHTRVAKLLTRALDEGRSTAQDVMDLPLIPLSNGSWAMGASRFGLYLPFIDDLEVPSRVQIRIVDKSITNPARLALFERLGVETATVDLVRRCILREYSNGAANMNITFDESKEHLEFMIKTQPLAEPGETGLKHLSLYTTEGRQVHPTRDMVYLLTDDLFGPWELLRRTDPGPDPGDGAPGLHRHFLHSAYIDDGSDEPDRSTEWFMWLYHNLDVDDVLSMASGQGTLSEEAEYVRLHRPEKFLGALHKWFDDYKSAMTPELIETIQSTEVLSRSQRMVPLKETYFPTEELEKRVERYVGPDAEFPWLWLEPDTTTQPSVPHEWKELIDVLEIGNQLNDLDIALDMLRISITYLQSEEGPLSPSAETLEKLLGLYQHVWSMLEQHEDRPAGKSMIRSFFHDETLCPIYVPAMLSDEGPDWASAEHCVWHAPQLMVSKTVISLMWERFLPRNLDFQHLEHFFTNVVGVAQCSYSTYVDELRDLKEEGHEDIDAIRIWYEELDRFRRSSSAFLSDDFKRPFEDEALIYIPSAHGPSWRKVSQCVWSTASRLRGKASLNDEYEELYDFFVEFLGVKPVDLEMAISELTEAGNDGSSAAVVRDSIWTVNSLLGVSEEWPGSDEALQSRILPVRLPSGEVSCLSKDAEFFVVDRELYRVAFERHVKLLDFTLAEVAELGPFMSWANLEGRYLSNCVKEVTSFGGGEAVTVLNGQKQICNRAHALLRIAKQYGSPRVSSRSSQDSFYELLRNTQILGTDGISSDIQVKQDGRTYTEQGKSNAVFIHEHESQLKVYVPRRKKEQTQAFKIKLPRKFLEWMMTDFDTQMREAISDKSVAAIEHVFNTPRGMLEETLEEDGIATIDIENNDDIPDDDTDTDTDSTTEGEEDPAIISDNDSVAAAGTQEVLTRELDAAGDLEDDDNASFSVDGVNTPSDTATSSLPIRTRRSLTSQAPVLEAITPPSAPSDDTQYASLLDYVIQAARAAPFPQRNEHGQAGFRLNGNNCPPHISASTQFERNCKVGAAGELFVFELLSNLGRQYDSLPGFTKDNWKSNVRELARAHQEYADLEPWRGVETSDIVYVDETDTLTTLLSEKGYFEDLWVPRIETPRYFIEVKTTTSDCATSFYMTRAQYALMQRSALLPWNGRDIYVIFRIYNLGQDSMGLQIYLDPERMRRQNRLVFTGEKWSVTPGTA